MPLSRLYLNMRRIIAASETKTLLIKSRRCEVMRGNGVAEPGCCKEHEWSGWNTGEVASRRSMMGGKEQPQPTRSNEDELHCSHSCETRVSPIRVDSGGALSP
jgi:hypothetical protein